MAFHPFEVNVPHLAYAFLGGFVVIVSLFLLTLSLDSFCGLVHGLGFGISFFFFVCSDVRDPRSPLSFSPLLILTISPFIAPPLLVAPPRFLHPARPSPPFFLEVFDLWVCRFVEQLGDLDVHIEESSAISVSKSKSNSPSKSKSGSPSESLSHLQVGYEKFSLLSNERSSKQASKQASKRSNMQLASEQAVNKQKPKQAENARICCAVLGVLRASPVGGGSAVATIMIMDDR
jgi:hypothetical protein